MSKPKGYMVLTVPKRVVRDGYNRPLRGNGRAWDIVAALPPESTTPDNCVRVSVVPARGGK